MVKGNSLECSYCIYYRNSGASTPAFKKRAMYVEIHRPYIYGIMRKPYFTKVYLWSMKSCYMSIKNEC